MKRAKEKSRQRKLERARLQQEGQDAHQEGEQVFDDPDSIQYAPEVKSFLNPILNNILPRSFLILAQRVLYLLIKTEYFDSGKPPKTAST